jgi:sugar lactone lactonase YvrE
VVAGDRNAGGFDGDGGPAAIAAIDQPAALAVRPDGGFLIADAGNNRVRLVDASGRIRTIAGSAVPGCAGNGGRAVTARLGSPDGLAMFSDGSVAVADAECDAVWRIAPDGSISTLAGIGVRGYAGDGGPARAAQLNAPEDLAAESDGSLLVDDSRNMRIRRIAPDGTIATVAGGGTRPAYDGASATAVAIDPSGLAVLPDGGFLVSDDAGHRVWRVSPLGVMSAFAGNGRSNRDDNTRPIGDGGRALAALVDGPGPLAVATDGSVLLVDSGELRRVTTDGRIRAVAGAPGLSGSDPVAEPIADTLFAGISALVPTGDGGVLVADEGNNRVRFWFPDGPNRRLMLDAADAETLGAVARVERLSFRISAPAAVQLDVFGRGGRLARARARAHAGENRLVVRLPRASLLCRVRLIATGAGGQLAAAQQTPFLDYSRYLSIPPPPPILPLPDPTFLNFVSLAPGAQAELDIAADGRATIRRVLADGFFRGAGYFIELDAATMRRLRNLLNALAPNDFEGDTEYWRSRDAYSYRAVLPGRNGFYALTADLYETRVLGAPCLSDRDFPPATRRQWRLVRFLTGLVRDELRLHGAAVPPPPPLPAPIPPPARHRHAA